jgi:NTP pyrophosphatase (non-canonical NTP hydrolase)
MGNGGTEPLNVTIFERHVLETDKLGPEPHTALLGLFGEIGSLVSALKKSRRDTDGYFGYRAAIVEEIGDVLWYAAAVARRGGISLAEAAVRVAATAGLGLDEVRLGDIAPPELAGGGEAAFERALLELAGEAGDLAKRFAGGDHRDNPDALRGDLIKLLRPLGRASVAAEVSLDEAGWQNVAKTESRWPIEEKFPPLFDDGLHPDEQLPRLVRMEIYERDVGNKTFVFQKCNGVLVGDRLTDNHEPPDDYRFHDVFHLAHAAVLGWSPVTRALFKVKRKSTLNIDENQDGARAVLIEEGLTTWIFETAKEHQFFGNTRQLGFDLLKAVKGFVQGYEPQDLPLWLWERAILQGYAVFRRLQCERRGVVIADMAQRELRFERLPE